MFKIFFLFIVVIFSLYSSKAQQKIIKFDASDNSRKINLIVGTNAGPYTIGNNQTDLTNFYKEIGVQSIRTHDYYGPCDWWTIFPKWNADPNVPQSYNFSESDKIILKIKNSGFDILFRLGVSWRGKNPLPINDPPGTIRDANNKITHNADTNDFKKFAEICKHIIMHYNEGWANGYYLNITKWEIWNEPTLKEQFWSGTPIQFFQMFNIVAKKLKESFPNILIGGPAQEGQVDLKFEQDFVKFCKDNNTPLDFYSYHSYGGEKSIASPWNIPQRAIQIKTLLDANNFKNTKIICDEWNAMVNEYNFSASGKGAAFYASSLIYGVYHNIPEMYQYRADNHPLGLINDDGTQYKQAAESMKAWKYLSQNKILINSQNSYDTLGFTSIATISENQDNIKILVSNFQNVKQRVIIIVFNLSNQQTNWSITRKLIDNLNRLTKLDSENISQAGNSIEYDLFINGESVQLLEFNKLIIQKPNKPILKQPLEESVLEVDTVNLIWHPSSPQVDFYHLEIYSGDKLLISDSTVADTFYNFVINHIDSVYSWRVRAKNQSGWGEWSDLWSFYIKREIVNIIFDSYNVKNIFILPNPASDYIEVSQTSEDSKFSEVLNIKIYNTLGECVMSVETQHAISQQRINISHLPSGVYFLKFGNFIKKSFAITWH